MTRVALFGANGFLGSHIAQVLQANDLEFVAISKNGRTQGSPLQHLRRGELHVRPALDLVTAGVTGISDALEHLQPIVIVNAVGALTGSESELELANLRTVQNLLEAAEKTIPHARVIHLGSAAEYGFAEPGSSVTEDAICNPIGVYANLKLKATQLMLASKLETVTLRIANPVGPRTPETLLPGAIAERLRKAILENTHEIRSGPLSDYRSYVDARDIAQAVLTVIHAENPPRLVNIASLRAVQVREVVTELIRLSGFQGELIEESALASLRSSAVPWQQADISRALALGWEPRFSLQQSLEDLWTGSKAGRSMLRPYETS